MVKAQCDGIHHNETCEGGEEEAMIKLWQDFLRACVRGWEKAFDPSKDLGKISQTKLYDLNAAAKRNVIYDRQGNRWPFREAL